VTLANDRYTYRVTWSEEDQEYVGLCVEYPSLSWLASSPEEALAGIRAVVAEVVADMEENHEPIPQPLATKNYSGRFMVRVPPELHRRLVLEAAEAGVSLNRLASTKLTYTASPVPHSQP
jgi:predicted HicB family RNase H-like nuclease